MLDARIMVGDAVSRLRELPDGVVRTCVTSPPYWGLRDYGNDGQLGMEATPQEFVENLCQVFDEVRRVLADDGTLWVNLGDTYANNGGLVQPQRDNSGGLSKTTLKTRGTQGHSGATGGFERAKSIGNAIKAKDLVGIPWRFAFAMQERGWYLRQDIIWAKPNPMPESVTDRCTKSHEYIFLFSKQPKYYYDHEAIKSPVKDDWGTRDRTNGKYHNEGTGLQPHSGLEKKYDMANKRSVWTVSTKPYKGAHFAVYPPTLIEPCILAGSAEGDTVLDPFSGSGTTGEVALKLGRNYVGIELNTDYAALSEKRITNAIGMLGEVTVDLC
jgi:DNA modification methylase